MTRLGTPSDAQVVDDTRHWLRRAVIGLNLCPFAKSVDIKNQVHYAISRAVGFNDMLADLRRELEGLCASPPELRDTTLLIAAEGFAEFLEFNGLLHEANRRLAKWGYEGVFQIASLHPRYQFADTDPGDLTNCTNQAPYPTLHLLREASIDRAVQAFPHAESIFQSNIATMRRLGRVGWDALQVQAGGSGNVDP